MGATCTSMFRRHVFVLGVLLLVLVFCAVAVNGKTRPKDYSQRTGSNNKSLCDVRGCNCTKPAGRWLSVNCTFNKAQDVGLHPGSIPSNTVEVSISGGNELTISAQSFHIVRAFALLRLEGIRHIIIKRSAFDNLNSTSLDLQVVACNYFLLENNAFKNMQTPIRAYVSRCGRVTVRSSAFGRLQEGSFSFIKHLELLEGAFQFENQGTWGRHGPVTNLSFHNVTIPSIPRNTFMSALAEIHVVDSEIGTVHAEAFTSPLIHAVFFNRSRIERLRSGAFYGSAQIYLLQITNCSVEVLESHAVMAAITNLTVEFSTINEVQSGAVNSTVTANIVISSNQIRDLAPFGFVFKGWNRLRVEKNIIKWMHANFLSALYNPDIVDFSFSDNEVWNVEAHALASIPLLQEHMVHFHFNGNFFNQSCHCNISSWLTTLLNHTHVTYVIESSYCPVDSLISNCFEIPQKVINMANFTRLVCGPGSTINCEPYRGTSKVVNASTVFLTGDTKSNSHVILYLTLASLFVVSIVGTLVILIVRGSLWLRNKRQCVRYLPDTAEDDIVTVTTDDSKLEHPEELTAELLAFLREQLEDPVTHDDARNMIENLYTRFVVEDGYGLNRSRQEDDQHLYEELGNMQSGIKPIVNMNKPMHNMNKMLNNKEPSDFLKVMEDRFSELSSLGGGERTRLATQYSDPIDAPVHVYSELRNKQDEQEAVATTTAMAEKRNSANGSLTFSSGTNGSGRMQFRPLPDKPSDKAGPSKISRLQY